MNMTLDFSAAERNAVELSAFKHEKALSTNYIDIVTDCCNNGGITPKNMILRDFPIVNWLMGTALTRDLRAKLNDGLCGFHKNSETGAYEVDVPATFWSTVPENDADACCWATMDFAKCGGSAPLALLCLKDCKNIQDDLMWELMRAGSRGAVEGINGANDTLNEVNDRIAELSMAFYTAYTVMLGSLDISTNILKPFHGLMEVMENPAVAHISGANILEAFDAWACRLAVLGGSYSDYVFAINPIMYQTLLREIKPGWNGELPVGWTKNGEEIRFNGIGFIQDRLVPVDLSVGTSEIWILNGDALGVFLGTDLVPSGRFVRYSGHQEQSKADGCGDECKFYYNIGGVFNNNANRIGVIYDLPISGVCLGATNDLTGLIQPDTLIPRGVQEASGN